MRLDFNTEISSLRPGGREIQQGTFLALQAGGHPWIVLGNLHAIGIHPAHTVIHDITPAAIIQELRLYIKEIVGRGCNNAGNTDIIG